MYQLKNKISNPAAITFYFIPGLGCVIKDKKGLRILDDINYFFEDAYPFHDIIFNNSIILTDWQLNYTVLNATNKSVTGSGKGQGFFDVSENFAGIELYGDKEEQFGIVDKNFNPVSIWQLNKHGTVNCMIEQHLIFLQSIHKAFGVAIGAAQPLWEFPLDTFGPAKFAQFAGYYKENVGITLSNGAVIFLNITNGKVHKHLPEAHINHGVSQSKPGSPTFYGLNNQLFIEIDAEKGTIVRQKDIGPALHSLTDKSFYIKLSKIYDNEFYFLAGSNHIGLLDIPTAQIKWIQKLEFSSKAAYIPVGEDKIQLHDNKLFIMDSMGDLHIFERNE